MAIECRGGGAGDVAGVVRVHREAFAGFFLSRLGPGFLSRYYRLVLEQPGGILVVASEQGAVIGFAAGFLSPAVFHSSLKKNRISFAWAILPALLRSPGLWARLWFDYRQVKAQAADSLAAGGDAGELSSIAVSPQWAGRGIGRMLLREFLDRFVAGGGKTVVLTTDADHNETGNAFYQRFGFTLTRSFSQPDGRRMNEYRLEVGPLPPAGGQ